MDKQRRKLLQSTAILGVASGMLGLSGVLGLQGCDSNQSKMPPKIWVQRELSAQIQHNTQIQEEQQWNLSLLAS